MGGARPPQRPTTKIVIVKRESARPAMAGADDTSSEGKDRVQRRKDRCHDGTREEIGRDTWRGETPAGAAGDRVIIIL